MCSCRRCWILSQEYLRMSDIDLRPFGINLQLKSSYIVINPYLTQERIDKATSDANNFYIGGKTYKKGAKLGEGSYGAAYNCIGPGGKEFAIKVVKEGLETVNDFQNFLKEIIIQIILATVSEDQPNGPYVPRIFHVGFDAQNKHGYMVSELMRGTLNSLITKLSADENDIVIPAVLDQIAHILDFFGKKLHFNHRDFKDDNIMYVKEDGKRLFKLIDFGFSCLKWNNLQISGGSIFKPSSTCFKKERDLGQLLYNIRRYTPSLSEELKQWLTKALMAEVAGEKCSVTEGCELHGRKVIQGWRNTYEFFDRSNVHPLYASPTTLLRKIKHLQRKQPFETPVVKEPKRSITRNSKNTEKPCSEGKIRNPATRRCVKVSGSPGKKAAKQLGIPKDALVPLNKPEKECPPGKILNPTTGRCVKADGELGKFLQRIK